MVQDYDDYDDYYHYDDYDDYDDFDHYDHHDPDDRDCDPYCLITYTMVLTMLMTMVMLVTRSSHWRNLPWLRDRAAIPPLSLSHPPDHRHHDRHADDHDHHDDHDDHHADDHGASDDGDLCPRRKIDANICGSVRRDQDWSVGGLRLPVWHRHYCHSVMIIVTES